MTTTFVATSKSTLDFPKPSSQVDRNEDTAQPSAQQSVQPSAESDAQSDAQPSTQLDAETEEHYDDDDSEGSDEAELAMARAQVRAQAFVNRSSSSDSVAQDFDHPPLVRKKSGELVKSSLRSRPELTRTKSEPTRPKNVHFNQKLEDVRPFRKSQRPSAVNLQAAKHHFHTADTETTDNDDDDYEDGHDSDDEGGWTLLTPGFVPHRYGARPGPERPVVYLDTLQLTNDRTAVSGSIFVQNRGFSKSVAVRYTIDGWRTFSESQATWSDDVRKYDRDAGYDRFNVTLSLRYFSPKTLADTVMFLAVRFNVNGEEFWDNNAGHNYELYLRNAELMHLQKLRSQESKVSRGRAPVSVSSTPALTRLMTDSGVQPDKEAVKTILTKHPDESEPHHGFLSSAEIPIRQHRKSDKSRYSFEASYARPPQSPLEGGSPTAAAALGRPRYSVVKAQELAGAWLPRDAAVPMPEGLREGEGARSASAEPKPATQKFHAWESASYKDFVSKYCFYTPSTLESGSPQKGAKENLDLSDASSAASSALSSADSSDIDLPARRDIGLTLEREANRA